VVHRNAAVGQHQLEIPVAHREHPMPAQRPQDNLGRELPTLERSRLHHRTCSPSASLAVFLLEQAQDRKSATEPVSVHMARLEEQFATAFLQIEIQLG
jgi:hypothetical protein